MGFNIRMDIFVLWLHTVKMERLIPVAEMFKNFQKNQVFLEDSLKTIIISQFTAFAPGREPCKMC